MNEQSLFTEINERIVLPVLVALVLISIVAKGVVSAAEYVAGHTALVEAHAAVKDKQNQPNLLASDTRP